MLENRTQRPAVRHFQGVLAEPHHVTNYPKKQDSNAHCAHSNRLLCAQSGFSERYNRRHGAVVIETTLRVRYAETDQMGVVYYANYLIWMEVGRVEFCRAQGIRYRDMEEADGILLVVAEANCRYLAPARYDDEVRIVTTLATSHPPHDPLRLRTVQPDPEPV